MDDNFRFNFDSKNSNIFNSVSSQFQPVQTWTMDHLYGNEPNKHSFLEGSQPVGVPTMEENNPVPRDFFDGVFQYIDQMLMEEEKEEHSSGLFKHSLALQAVEKSFYDVLGQKYPPEAEENAFNNPNDDCIRTSSSDGNKDYTVMHNDCDESAQGQFQEQSSVVGQIVANGQTSPPEYPFYFLDSYGKRQASSQFLGSQGNIYEMQSGCNDQGIGSKFGGLEINLPSSQVEKYSKRREYHREDGGGNLRVEEQKSNKQLASYDKENEQSWEDYDKVLLCVALNPDLHIGCVSCPCGAWNYKLVPPSEHAVRRGRPRRGGNKPANIVTREVVDLSNLLMLCAQAVARYDRMSADQLLKQIRLNSSPRGNSSERLAHYLAKGIEARLSGIGTSSTIDFATRRISSAAILKAYQVYFRACPFRRMSNIFANKSIGKLQQDRGAKKIHVIDFGIVYGFQWPCIIQGLSLRPGGPPKLRITGIDFPQPGFRPAERVEETGRHLANYCTRFGVCFEYIAIAKNWGTIQLEDLNIDRDENEIVIVNCLYRLGNVPDETLAANSPRDSVLKLIKKINPDMFVHGVINGTYNSPLFVSRFREAFFHYSALFDMFEATLLREDEGRLVFESEILGRDAVNVVAGENNERVERPETYRQWQARNARAGFRQLPLYQDVVKEVSAKVKSTYHKDFMVYEDSNWMLQGWKGKIIYALSCWKPVQDHQ